MLSLKVAILCIPRILCCHSAYIPLGQLWQQRHHYPVFLLPDFFPPTTRFLLLQLLSALVPAILLMQAEATESILTLFFPVHSLSFLSYTYLLYLLCNKGTCCCRGCNYKLKKGILGLHTSLLLTFMPAAAAGPLGSTAWM